MLRLYASTLTIGTLAAVSVLVSSSDSRAADGPPDQRPVAAAPKVGVQVNEPDAFQGYTLITPLQSTKTYLVDMKGRVVHTWKSKYTAGQDAYLLANGHLLRAANLGENEAFFAGASQGGRIQEFTWDGELIWDYKFHNEKQIRHHSITRMSNGNVLMNVWERKTPADFIAAGLKSDLAGTSDVLVDAIYEVQPSGKTGGKIVWEWHIWDHLIQDLDATKANFADVAAHPERADLNFYELIDVNFARTGGPAFGNLARFAGPAPNQNDSKKDDAKKPDGTKVDGKKPDGKKDNSLDRLKALGYVGAAGGRKFAGFLSDWTHCNSVAYNAKLDQVMVSCREFSEIWVIDHSTTSAEAASHRGGRYGKGGDLLYRWGNPQTYRAGTSKDQRLFNQHDASWIPDGLPGAGHMLVFNNGSRRPDGNYSSADEIVPPVDANGHYERKSGAAFGPKAALWSYSAPDQEQFFAPFMGGAQRLENGDTLMSTGFGGVVFEVTPQKKIDWRYVNPAKATGEMGVPGAFGGAGGPGGGPGGGPRFTPPPPNIHPIQLLPGFLPTALQLTPEQRKQVDEFETDASGRFEKSLNDHQRDQLKELQKSGGPFGFAGPPDLEHVLAKAIREKLEVTADQARLIDELQKQGEAKLKDLLKDDQKNQLKTMKDMMQDMMKAFAGRPPGGGPGRPGGPGGFMGFGGGGDFAGGSGIFRAYRYSPDFAGLKGKDLKPGKTIEELEAKPKEVSMK